MEATQFLKIGHGQVACGNNSNEGVDFESFEEDKLDTDQMILKPSLVSQFRAEMQQVLK